MIWSGAINLHCPPHSNVFYNLKRNYRIIIIGWGTHETAFDIFIYTKGREQSRWKLWELFWDVYSDSAFPITAQIYFGSCKLAWHAIESVDRWDVYSVGFIIISFYANTNFINRFRTHECANNNRRKSNCNKLCWMTSIEVLIGNHHLCGLWQI